MLGTYDLKLVERYLEDSPKSALNDQLIIAARTHDPNKPSLKELSKKFLDLKLEEA